MHELSEEIKKLFQYDSTLPFDYADKIIKQENGIALHDINYASPKTGKVTAYLILPSNRKPVAGFIIGHWGLGTRTQYIPEAKSYAKAGIACLLLDFPWVRPAPWRQRIGNYTKPEIDYEVYIQAVVDIRRSIDLLQNLTSIQVQKIACIGHSIGAQCGCIATAIDPRIQAFVVVGGVPSTESVFMESDDPDIVGFRNMFKKEDLDKYFTTMRVFDPINYVSYISPRPILFQFARFERYFGEKAMNEYYSAAYQPKVVKWYDTGHELNDFPVMFDRAQWLQKHLRIKGLVTALRKAARLS
ncbi:MAG: acetylxylan esterase [candidate division WOR-3 bacterium]|nr:acetylxylan esterase [candidate division WOR-3 bacterium]